MPQEKSVEASTENPIAEVVSDVPNGYILTNA